MQSQVKIGQFVSNVQNLYFYKTIHDQKKLINWDLKELLIERWQCYKKLTMKMLIDLFGYVSCFFNNWGIPIISTTYPNTCKKKVTHPLFNYTLFIQSKENKSENNIKSFSLPHTNATHTTQFIRIYNFKLKRVKD